MDTLIVNRPGSGQYPAYYDNYYKWLPEGQPILELWQHAIQDALEFWHSINSEEASFRYEASKWSIKQMLLHISDTERIFGFRALSLSRGEQANLSGFDHNSYVDFSGADDREWASILQEYQHVKQANYDLFASLNSSQWEAEGTLGDQRITVAAIAYVLPGHDRHHQEIVKSRYLSKLRNS